MFFVGAVLIAGCTLLLSSYYLMVAFKKPVEDKKPVSFTACLVLVIPPTVFVGGAFQLFELEGDEALKVAFMSYCCGAVFTGFVYTFSAILGTDLSRSVFGEFKRFLWLVVLWPLSCYRYGSFTIR